MWIKNATSGYSWKIKYNYLLEWFSHKYSFSVHLVNDRISRNYVRDKTEKTSSAWSATLGDTSWARLIIKQGPCNSLKKANLWLHLASWNFPNFLLCLESKTEPSVAKAQNYRGGHRTYILDEWNKWDGDTTQLWKKAYTGRGGHRTYLVGVGTPHNIYRKSLAMGGWVVPARE